MRRTAKPGSRLASLRKSPDNLVRQLAIKATFGDSKALRMLYAMATLGLI